MDSIDALMAHVKRNRPLELRELKKSGKKIVGFPPGNWVPEELIYAAGAVPICLLRGGDPEAVATSSAYIPRFVDTFCRSQIGYRVLGEDPYYQLLDLLICPLTDRNQCAIADCFNFYTDLDVFVFGVPHYKEQVAVDYYADGLRMVVDKLEQLTGNKITDDKLKEAIELYNRIRATLRDISLTRKSPASPISGKDFVRLNHSSYLLDPLFYVAKLDDVTKELSQKPAAAKTPRILVTASTLALGDHKVLDLIEKTGAAIVIEEIPEGVRNYWHDVELNGDPVVQLAETYLRKKTPPAYFRPSFERIDFISRLVEEFKVDGILWYQLMYRNTYDIQSFYFAKIVKDKLELPFLKLQSDYDVSETGAFRTRIETFVEMAAQR
jgi:benzoyl-CoA reductase/2-hydroxyglutaryl-CoA dehydratase subunit BcrC/BadD/HgdB